jgi:hypothetical protein
MTDTHYDISITVTKVQFKDVKNSGSTGRPIGTEQRRVVSEAGRVNIKHVDFNTAKELAGQHLELLTEFTGSDPRRGHTRDGI